MPRHWLRAAPGYGLSLLIALILLTAPMPARSEPTRDREALSQPLPGLSDDDRARFLRGRSLFRQSWVIAPARDREVDGLGPLYNRLACISCHAKNGRGGAPANAGERMQSMLVRLSVPDAKAPGSARPHPVYGDQLNEEGIPGVAGEGRAELRWRQHTATLRDGTHVPLRRPEIRIVDLAYGPLGPVQISLRVAPHVAGLGLLEAVADSTLADLARARKPDGVRGRINHLAQGQFGRFGLKSNQPTLRQQNASAFAGDLGITSGAFPHTNCTATQTACQQAPNGGEPELSDTQLDDLTFYVAHLAPPPRRNTDLPAVRQGETLFAAWGCAQCHRPELTTASDAPPALADQRFAPYTDLLLHDMGAELADGRPDYQASGREWRTAPLWGFGLLAAINENVGFLHDGRARTAEEAILWHGGEARVARRRYAAAPASARAALLAFLDSL